jgi:oxygen-independent coproporphyrinogen-3 oxidase
MKLHDVPLALYVHIPFCERKCAYCDFNAYSGMANLAEPLVASLHREIERAADTAHSGRLVTSVFFGGGTPTFLTGAQLSGLLDALRRAFQVADDAEITSEANPTSADSERFARMHDAGFNRLSIGVQAFDDALLQCTDRQHTAQEAEDALHTARRAGFTNLSLDLMFGLPTQTRDDWQKTLERALDIGTEHLSTYALTLEPGTRFERLHAGGKLPLPDEDDELWMYEHAMARLTAAGFDHYEVSNFARPGYQSRHNRVYWHNEEYLGFGPGAVSYVDGRRWKKEKQPSRYIAKVRSGDDLCVESDTLTPEQTFGETLMLGLRLREGVTLSRLRTRFHRDPLEKWHEIVEKLIRQGLLEQEGDTLRLSKTGLLFANNVFVEFLD